LNTELWPLREKLHIRKCTIHGVDYDKIIKVSTVKNPKKDNV